MSLLIVVLLVAAAAVVATVGLTLGVRLSGAIAARRLDRYLTRSTSPAGTGEAVGGHVLAYVVEARDDPPRAPRGRFEQRVLRQRLVALAPSVKGDARERLGSLFRRYGLVELAHRDLSSRDALTRIRAAEALAAMGVVEAVPWLRERLEGADALLALACARALAELGAVDALPDAMAALSALHADPGEVAEILLTFGPLGVPFLRERLRDAPAAERRLGAAALGEIRALEAAGELRAALADPDDEVTAAAARALGRIGDHAARESLAALLSSPDGSWFVRVAAAGALGGLDDPGAAPALVAALADEHWDVRNAASHSLAALGDAGIDAVAAALDDVPDRGIAHFAGVLDVEWRLEAVVARASDGSEGLERLVDRAAAAGVRARLEELAEGGPLAAYAASVLEREGAAA